MIIYEVKLDVALSVSLSLSFFLYQKFHNLEMKQIKYIESAFIQL